MEEPLVTDQPADMLVLARALGLSSRPMLDRLQIPPAAQDPLVAGVLGITPDHLAAIRDGFRTELSATADALLADAAFAAAASRLPFTADDTVVVLGDSLTADALSWANLLEAVLARIGTGTRIVNRAVSGRTTGETIGTFLASVAYRPTWIVILLGTNDARRHGTRAAVRMASATETARNIRLLLEFARVEAGARTLTITPPPANPAAVQANREQGGFWLPEDIAEVAGAVKAADPEAIDLFSQVDTGGEFWQADGLHPTEAGQQTMLRTIVALLAERCDERLAGDGADEDAPHAG